MHFTRTPIPCCLWSGYIGYEVPYFCILPTCTHCNIDIVIDTHIVYSIATENDGSLLLKTLWSNNGKYKKRKHSTECITEMAKCRALTYNDKPLLFLQKIIMQQSLHGSYFYAFQWLPLQLRSGMRTSDDRGYTYLQRAKQAKNLWCVYFFKKLLITYLSPNWSGDEIPREQLHGWEWQEPLILHPWWAHLVRFCGTCIRQVTGNHRTTYQAWASSHKFSFLLIVELGVLYWLQLTEKKECVCKNYILWLPKLA